MSTKIDLKIVSKLDLELLSKNIHFRLIRLLGRTQLRNSRGWLHEEHVIIDTGSPVSVIPYSMWSKADVRLLLPDTTRIFGLGADDDDATGLSGKLGEITLVFKDQKMTSPPIKVKAHLLNDDSAPFIIGFEDVLTETKLVCDYKQQSAYLEF